MQSCGCQISLQRFPWVLIDVCLVAVEDLVDTLTDVFGTDEESNNFGKMSFKRTIMDPNKILFPVTCTYRVFKH